jgi:hypothetical protein
MPDQTDSSFPFMKTLTVLSALALLLGAILYLVIPQLLKSPNDAQQGVGFMAIVVWFSSLISVLPLARGNYDGPIQLMKAYFIGAGLRVVVCLLALVVAIKMMNLSPIPLVATLFVMYLPLLFTETGLVVRHLKRCNFGSPPESNSPEVPAC